MPEPPPLQHILELRAARGAPGVFDLSLQGLQALKRFHEVECHVVLYPYGRELSSSDFFFHPFEEYVDDLSRNKRSAYYEAATAASHLFGLSLGAALALLAAEYGPSRDLLSVETTASVLGAYLIGRDVWADLERALIGLTKGWRLRYLEPVYSYRLERLHTLTGYSALARRERYGRAVMLPEQLHFIQEANSQTVRMAYDMRDLRALADDAAHLLTIQVPPDKLDGFQRAGYLLGVKLSFNRRLLGTWQCYEVFQSIHRHAPGCIGPDGAWKAGQAFYRRTWRVGRLKRFVAEGLLPAVELVRREGGVDAPPPPPPPGPARATPAPA